LSSAVLKWPGRESVVEAARRWAARLRADDPRVLAVGCIGSAARGVDWGAGSDLDLVVIVRDTPLSAAQRYQLYCPCGLPVPADLWTYTRSEWQRLACEAPACFARLRAEWLALAGQPQGPFSKKPPVG
jgi:hypothetical protein